MICDGVNCCIRKCTIYYPWLWLLINIVVISHWRWSDWFHSNLENNCECALIIKVNRWYIYRCNNWHRHKSCPNLVEWPIYERGKFQQSQHQHTHKNHVQNECLSCLIFLQNTPSAAHLCPHQVMHGGNSYSWRVWKSPKTDGERKKRVYRSSTLLWARVSPKIASLFWFFLIPIDLRVKKSKMAALLSWLFLPCICALVASMPRLHTWCCPFCFCRWFSVEKPGELKPEKQKRRVHTKIKHWYDFGSFPWCLQMMRWSLR